MPSLSRGHRLLSFPLIKSPLLPAASCNLLGDVGWRTSYRPCPPGLPELWCSCAAGGLALGGFAELDGFVLGFCVLLVFAFGLLPLVEFVFTCDPFDVFVLFVFVFA